MDFQGLQDRLYPNEEDETKEVFIVGSSEVTTATVNRLRQHIENRAIEIQYQDRMSFSDIYELCEFFRESKPTRKTGRKNQPLFCLPGIIKKAEPKQNGFKAVPARRNKT